MTKPQRKRPPRLQKRGRDSTDVAEHPQSSGDHSNDQFELPIRTAVTSIIINPDLLSRSNAPAPVAQGVNVNAVLRTTDFSRPPVKFGTRSYSVDAAGNVSSDLSLGSNPGPPALEGSSVDPLLCPPASRKPSVYSGGRSGSLDASRSVDSNHALRSFATTPAFQGFSFNLRSRSVSTDTTQTPVNAGKTANVDGVEGSIGVEGIVKHARKLPILELVYLAEVVDFQVRAHGILRLERATYDPYARPPTKFDRARSSKMIEDGRKADERMAEVYQQGAENRKKRRRMEEARKEALETMQESLLKLKENEPSE